MFPSSAITREPKTSDGYGVCRREAATSRALAAAQDKEAWATAKEKEASDGLEACRVQQEVLRAELSKAEAAQEIARSETEQAGRVASYFAGIGWRASGAVSIAARETEALDCFSLLVLLNGESMILWHATALHYLHVQLYLSCISLASLINQLLAGAAGS